MTKRVLTVNLLKTLKFKNIGTNEIEYHLKNKRWDFHWISRMRKSMLNVRLDHAYVELSKAKAVFSRQLSYLSRRWGHNTVITSHFKQIMQDEVDYFWQIGKTKNLEKIDHLKQKWRLDVQNRSKKSDVDMWRDIAISDKALTEALGVKEPEVAAYGEVELSDDEKEALKLPPKFTSFEQINKTLIQTACEVLNAKIRMEQRARERREGRPWSPDEEYEDIKQRVTDLSFNRRINVPKAQNVQIETILANMTSRILGVTEKFAAEKCDKYGNIKDKNMTQEEISGMKSLKDRIKENEILRKITSIKCSHIF